MNELTEPQLESWRRSLVEKHRVITAGFEVFRPRSVDELPVEFFVTVIDDVCGHWCWESGSDPKIVKISRRDDGNYSFMSFDEEILTTPEDIVRGQRNGHDYDGKLQPPMAFVFLTKTHRSRLWWFLDLFPARAFASS